MKRLLFLTGTLVFLLTGCSQDDIEKTDLGTEVTFLVRGEGDKLISGQICNMSLRYSSDGIVMRDSEGETLPYQYFEDSLNINGEFASVLEILSVGDSVVFEVNAVDLFEKTFRQPLPDSIPRDSKIEWVLYVDSQMTQDEYQAVAIEKQEQEARERLADEERRFDEFLAQENIETIKTESGLQYVITELGSGVQATEGQRVEVKYKGTLFEGGKVFDEGVYTFPLGQGQVIRGWDEGISYMPVGTKGILYIPSSLGYGPRGRGPIPPSAPLVFEVEVLSVK